jgi:hypothetical protein
MVGPVKPNHLEGEGLCPIVGQIPKCYEQVDQLERYHLPCRHNAMELRPRRANARPIDAHGIQSPRVHDVEATAPIHHYLGEAIHVDDRVDHERAPP